MSSRDPGCPIAIDVGSELLSLGRGSTLQRFLDALARRRSGFETLAHHNLDLLFPCVLAHCRSSPSPLKELKGVHDGRRRLHHALEARLRSHDRDGQDLCRASGEVSGCLPRPQVGDLSHPEQSTPPRARTCRTMPGETLSATGDAIYAAVPVRGGPPYGAVAVSENRYVHDSAASGVGFTSGVCSGPNGACRVWQWLGHDRPERRARHPNRSGLGGSLGSGRSGRGSRDHAQPTRCDLPRHDGASRLHRGTRPCQETWPPTHPCRRWPSSASPARSNRHSVPASR